jgi:glycine/D-amino acid oxidase-like deaminating enzyme
VTDQSSGGAERRPRAISRRTFLAGAALGGAAVLGADYGFRALSEGASFKPRGFSRARPIETDTGPLPAQVDVAIIGGGFAGICSAFSLASRGVSVAVFEKGVVAGEASGRSAGMITSMLCGRSHLELIEYSKQQWRGLNEATGEQTGFLQDGGSNLFVDEEDLEESRAWLEEVKGLPNGGARLLSASEATQLVPGSTLKLIGGLQAPGDGSGEPALAVPAIALGARKRNAKVYQACAVRAIETSAGRVSGVHTERGSVKARVVVLAGGVWSPVLAYNLGLELPLAQGFVSMASVPPFEHGPAPGSVSLLGPYVGWRKQYDGGYAIWQFASIAPVVPSAVRHMDAFWPLLRADASIVKLRFSPDMFLRWMSYKGKVPLDQPGIFEQMRIYEPELRGTVIDAGIARLQDVMPVFRLIPVRERWTGAMSMTPDTKPVLSEVNQVGGLIMATGLYDGLTVGPGVGEIVADLATGKRPAIDVTAFKYERLIDGTHLNFAS